MQYSVTAGDLPAAEGWTQASHPCRFPSGFSRTSQLVASNVLDTLSSPSFSRVPHPTARTKLHISTCAQNRANCASVAGPQLFQKTYQTGSVLVLSCPQDFTKRQRKSCMNISQHMKERSAVTGEHANLELLQLPSQKTDFFSPVCSTNPPEKVGGASHTQRPQGIDFGTYLLPKMCVLRRCDLFCRHTFTAK